jgi:predicted nucleotidyltransferase
MAGKGFNKVVFFVTSIVLRDGRCYDNFMNIEEIKRKIIPILLRYSVKRAAVFGSVARGEAKPESDVDILVEFEKTPSLVQFIKMENELKEVLDKEVDVVVRGSEKPLIKPLIYKERVGLYGSRFAI